MVEEKNNGHSQNSHPLNNNMSTPTSTTTSTTTATETNRAGNNSDNSIITVSTLAINFMNWIDPFVDFSWFILCSIGFILQVGCKFKFVIFWCMFFFFLIHTLLPYIVLS